jgi:hypothetical protein
MRRKLLSHYGARFSYDEMPVNLGKTALRAYI